MIAALLIGLAAWFATAPPTRLPADPVPATRRSADQSLLLRLRPLIVAGAWLGGWWLLSPPLAPILATVIAVISWRVLGNAEAPAVRERRERLHRDLPLVVRLLATALGGGLAVVSALDLVADAVPGPAAEELRRIRRRLELGDDPVRVWRDASQVPGLRPLGQAMARSARSGAAVGEAAIRLAADLRAEAASRAAAVSRTVEVRSAAPLGICLLPAFIAVGVVPLVAGIFSGFLT